MAIRFPLVTPLGFQILTDRLNPVLKTLHYRERHVIKMLYGMESFDDDGFTHEQAGEVYELTATRIRQIESVVFRKMRTPKRLRMLADFFDTASRLKTPERFLRFISRIQGV